MMAVGTTHSENSSTIKKTNNEIVASQNILLHIKLECCDTYMVQEY